MNVVRLSRRNLLTLLSKLDRKRAGEDTYCAILKGDGTLIVAQEDSPHYGERSPGVVHPLDEPPSQEN